jgi:putative component of toxin-antitoxin plasmid stabilization module
MHTPGTVKGFRQPIVRLGNPKRVNDLDISAAEEGCIISRAGCDRIYFVNRTAALILELCTGESPVEQIADLVKQAYNLPQAPVEDTREVLKQLEAEGLVLRNGAEPV